jgi:subtilase family serine protease
MACFRRGLALGAAGTVLALSWLVWEGVVGTASTSFQLSAQHAGLVLHPTVRTLGITPSTSPPTEGYCVDHYSILCYGAPQVEAAYGLPALYREGLDGRGETIVLVDSFGAPDIRQDLAVFDRAYGLATPPKFTILKYGPVPAYTSKTPTATGWAEETTLDVEWSHAMAPVADILLVETATDETVGASGFPTMVNAENYVINHHLGDVISQSFAAGEATFKGPATILGLRGAYENAYRNGVTVLAGAGDWGPTQIETVTAKDYLPFRDVGWPASDPLVTAIGGTQLTLNTRGIRTAPDRVWNDTTLEGRPFASGGGLSTVFTRPSYQNGVAGVVGSRRGVPDISMSASWSGSVNIYLSGVAAGTGWIPIAGTSEATPLFAGIVAIADQLNTHRPLGMIDPALYAMEAAHDPGIVPVTTGTTSVFYTTTAKKIRVTIPGFSAGAGYNLATGLGTITAPDFVRELVQTVRRVRTTVTYSDLPTSFLSNT